MDAAALKAEIERTTEEIIVQRVLINSLTGDDPDVQETREEFIEQMDELKRTLQRLKNDLRAKLAAASGSQTSTTLTAGVSSSASSSFKTEPTSMTSASSFGSGSVPGAWPSQSQDGTRTPSQGSNVDRLKRALGSPTTSGRDKSRRSSPIPAASNPFGSDLEIIDLTGDDVAVQSNIVADQVRREQLHKQAQEDRRYAEQLSSQDPSMYQTLYSSQNAPAGPSNALSRLMDTQRANAPSSSQSTLKVEYPGYEAISSGESTPAEASQTLPSDPTMIYDGINYGVGFPVHRNIMPGTLPGSSAFELSSLQNIPVRPSNIRLGQPGQIQYSNSMENRPMAPQRPGLPSNRIFMEETEHGFRERGSGITVAFNRGGPSAMADIINRTGAYSMAGMQPGWNPASGMMPGGMPGGMSDRMATYIENMYHDPRVSEKELDELLQNIRPDMDIPEDARGETPEGLKNSLYRHQELAVAWMKKMEEGTNKGGILADDMGLGKTISTLALILSRKADSSPKTNLIIGPLSLARQWEEEIKSKIKSTHSLSVFVYHNKKATSKDLLKYDIVLTTYGTIAQEFKRLEKFMLENRDRQIDYSDRDVSLKFPLLNPKDAHFYRVILDEAQCIKNKTTQTSLACHQLKATYRWCLTGTPMMNGILELYPLVRFLKIKPYAHWEQFRNAFGVLFGRAGDPKHKAMHRLRALLKAIMLRRKKDSMLDGKPILRLPPKTEEVVYAEFSPDERDFYNQLEKKSQVLFNKYLRENTVGKNYSSILVLLLRLRQACCHPHLNMDVDDVSPMTDEEMIEIVKTLDPTIVRRIQEMQAFECPICYDAVQSPTFFVPCGHDSCKQCLTRIVDNASTQNLQEGNESDNTKCPVCRGKFDPRKCFSYEAFQTVHMPEALAKAAEEAEEEEEEDTEGDDDDDEIVDTESESESDEEEVKPDVDKRGNLTGFIIDDGFFDSETEDEKNGVKPVVSGVKEEDEDEKKPIINGTSAEEPPTPAEARKSKKEARRAKRRSKAKGKAKAKPSKKGKEQAVKVDVKPGTLKQLRKEGAKNRLAYQKYMAYLRQTWLPAAKVEECMKLLRQADADGEKTIIFSQWTLLLDLIEVGMHHEGFEHAPRRYDGGLSGDQRAEAAKDFRDRDTTRVMLVSLRAGNAGLNLTSATRVIIMDPFWNPYIEMQAVDRAYRIGQQKEVKVYRILTKETVEDRIVTLKEQKKEIVEAALDEKESAKIGRLNTRELRYLFNGD